MSRKRQNYWESLVLCDLSVLRNRTSGLLGAVPLNSAACTSGIMNLVYLHSLSHRDLLGDSLHYRYFLPTRSIKVIVFSHQHIKMRELLVHRGPEVDSPIPLPAPGQVTIKVHVVAANPKDWKVSECFEDRAINEGEDIAGTIYAIGEGPFGVGSFLCHRSLAHSHT